MPATRRTRDPNAFPTTQLFLLSLVRVSEPIAIVSIFPYAWELVKYYNIGSNADAAFYAGILIASFAFAEACTSFLWGCASDRLGRKPVLIFGCCGSILSLLVVGFSTSFWWALFGRSIGGLLNGNQGVIQSMVAELVTNPDHQAKGYAVMPFVWNVGTIVGPAIGGFFYNWFSESETWSRYPALMPNLVCAGFLLAAVLIGAFFIEETHPDFASNADADKDESSEYYSDDRPLLGNSGAIDQAPADLRDEHYGTFDHIEVRQTHRDSASGEKAFNRRVVMLVVALGIFTFHSMAYDNLIPIFFQDHRGDPDLAVAATNPDALTGGLGLSTQHVGVIMMFNGIIALFVQAVVFPFFAAKLGIWKSFLLVTVLHPLAYVIVPFLAFIPGSSTGLLNFSIYTCLTIRNIFGILAYPLVLILLKDACPGPAYLGRINGLAASVGAASRTIASPVAGALYTAGIQADFTALPWLVTAAIAVVGAVQIFFVGRQKDEAEVHVESAVVNIAHDASTSYSESE